MKFIVIGLLAALVSCVSPRKTVWKQTRYTLIPRPIVEVSNDGDGWYMEDRRFRNANELIAALGKYKKRSIHLFLEPNASCGDEELVYIAKSLKQNGGNRISYDRGSGFIDSVDVAFEFSP